jgi:hypothetical protein
MFDSGIDLEDTDCLGFVFKVIVVEKSVALTFESGTGLKW